LNISSATATPPPGPPFDEFATSGGALLYGLTKAALDRFSVGLAAEVYADGIAVNSLSPVAAVKTEGAEALKMIPPDRPDLIEPVEVMVEAAIALCTGDPRTLTGRVVCSRSLLEELGRTPRTLDGKADFYEERAGGARWIGDPCAREGRARPRPTRSGREGTRRAACDRDRRRERDRPRGVQPARGRRCRRRCRRPECRARRRGRG